jgi:hypothetical protein
LVAELTALNYGKVAEFVFPSVHPPREVAEWKNISGHFHVEKGGRTADALSRL